MESEPTPEDAAQALAAMRQATARARPFRLPLWYHVGVGAVLGCLVAVQALPLPGRVAGFVLTAVGVVLLARYYRRVSGRVVNGFRWGRTLPAALVMLGVAWAMLALALPGLVGPEPLLSPWLGGLITFVVAVPADWFWVRAYQAELVAQHGGDQP